MAFTTGDAVPHEDLSDTAAASRSTGIGLRLADLIANVLSLHGGPEVEVDEDDEAKEPDALPRVRSRRPAVLRRLHAIDARRLQETRSWVVSFSILRPFGPSRATATPRAGALGHELVRAHAAAAVVARSEDWDSIGISRMSGRENNFG